MSNKDLVEVCNVPETLHYRFYPYRKGSLVQSSKECLLKLQEEKIKKDNGCFAILFGYEHATWDDVSGFAHSFWDLFGRPSTFVCNFFFAGEKHRGVSLLVA